MRLILLVLSITVLSVSSYTLQVKYSGATFFDGWDFFTAGDPTHGTVDYVSEAVAKQNGLITAGTKVYIGSDHTNKVPKGARGRQSVKITTKQVFNYGLFIMDLDHMPAGCGTWPAWWLVGPNWPNNGEIDIIEGIDLNTAVGTSLHTSNGCSMANESASLFTGHWGMAPGNKSATNCFINAPGQYNNQGCGITGAENSYGFPFNKAGGGVYVLEWNPEELRAWLFLRNAIPADITSGNPNPDGWGKPYALFQLGATSGCPDNHFKDTTMIINLTFCGDYAGGNNFKAQCGNDGNCADWVENHPEGFTEAYWSINYVAVYN